MDGAFRAKISPALRTRLKYGASAPLPLMAFPCLYWAMPSFLLKGIVWRDCAAFSNAGLLTIRNGARGRWGARVEN
jgi:hypothetical protein